MKKILVAFAVILLAASSVIAQKIVYDDHVEKRNVNSFHAIESSAGVEVIITKGAKEELAVSASDKDVLNKVETVVKNGVLKISRETDWKFWNSFKNVHIKVYVSYVELDALEASSGSSIKGTDVQFNKLMVKQSSGSLIDISGTVESLDVNGNSGSLFKGYELKTTNCSAAVSSGANAKISVAKELIARASSGGSIHYKGEAVIRDIHVSSGGNVKKQIM
jgi:hypothetical protein